MRELSEMVRSLNQRLEGAEALRRRTQEEIGGLSRPAAPPPVVAPAVPIRSRAESYAVALTLFQSGEYGQAVLDFMDLVATYPGHMLAPHAQFWIAEAYDIDRDCGSPRHVATSRARASPQRGRGAGSWASRRRRPIGTVSIPILPRAPPRRYTSPTYGALSSAWR